MNKKKLSVVMAGAMLASSVSPVLAATESTVNQNELGSLVEKVYEKLTKGEKITSSGRSVYGVKIKGEKTINATIDALTVKGSEEALRKELQEQFKVLTVGDTVEIFSKGFRTDENGDIVLTETVAEKYETTDFVLASNKTSKGIAEQLTGGSTGSYGSNVQLIGSITDETNLDKGNKIINTTDTKSTEIKFQRNIDLSALAKEGFTVSGDAKTGQTLTIAAGDKKLDFTKVLLKDETTKATKDLQSSDLANIVGFPIVNNTASPIGEKLIETITVEGKENNYKTEDLYDGLMLTTEGHDFLSLIKAASKKTGYDVTFKRLNGQVISSSSIDLSEYKTEFGFVVEIKDKKGYVTKYTVKGAEKQTEVLANWLFDKLAKVDILAGDNRYETAVSVAKEQLGMAEGELGKNTNVSNIVLVNGESLVDGLTAAPLAASLKANEGASEAAPILLTKTNELPKATKDFLKEILAEKEIGNVNTTIHLVGGTSVLSKSLEKELRSYGFDIERYNGANREETSLEVAEAIDNAKNATNERFVVGAEGEADAMSIAPVAAAGDGTDVTPIIVAKKGGISYQALDELDKKDVTVVGGEASISKEEYEAIEEATGKNGSIERVAGENRQATNAAIIKKYYYSDAQIENGLEVESVIVSKDGRGNKEELVDALTVANLAVQEKAPIVLAKSSLSAEQLDAIRLRGKKSEKLYQVGIGVERSVMETVASKLGLLNK